MVGFFHFLKVLTLVQGLRCRSKFVADDSVHTMLLHLLHLLHLLFVPTGAQCAVTLHPDEPASRQSVVVPGFSVCCGSDGITYNHSCSAPEGVICVEYKECRTEPEEELQLVVPGPGPWALNPVSTEAQCATPPHPDAPDGRQVVGPGVSGFSVCCGSDGITYNKNLCSAPEGVTCNYYSECRTEPEEEVQQLVTGSVEHGTWIYDGGGEATWFICCGSDGITYGNHLSLWGVPEGITCVDFNECRTDEEQQLVTGGTGAAAGGAGTGAAAGGAGPASNFSTLATPESGGVSHGLRNTPVTVLNVWCLVLLPLLTSSAQVKEPTQA